MRAIFIRHGQSTGNAGIPADDLALFELTELGWTQSREVTTGWTEAPTVIMTSTNKPAETSARASAKPAKRTMTAEGKARIAAAESSLGGAEEG